MNKLNKHFDKIFENSDKYIEGIFNYCDRWCERCTKTTRCSLFAMEKAIRTEYGSNDDISNEQFWQKIADIFDASRTMIEENAKRLGIDIQEAAETQLTVSSIDEGLDKQARQFSIKLMKWLDENESLFEQKSTVQHAISDKQFSLFNEALEIIHWYALFIATKTHRLLIVFDDHTANNTLEKTDKLGTAKNLLIALARTKNAMVVLYNHLKERETEMLQFLATISKIEKKINQLFPEALLFKRPGLDE